MIYYKNALEMIGNKNALEMIYYIKCMANYLQ